MSKGTYIVVEGNPATGKSTIIERLARELQAAQIPVQIIIDSARPQDITTQAIRRIMDDPRYPVNTRAEVLLYNAVDSRSLEAIQKAVDAGTVCITDSSFLTTLVNEYYGRGDIRDYTAAVQINQFATGNLKPDLLVLLDAPVETLKQRMDANKRDHIDDSYLERVRAGYLWEAKQRNLPIVYATDPIDTVFGNVWQHVRSVVGISEKMVKESKVQSVSEVLAANPPTKVAPSEPPITEGVATKSQNTSNEVSQNTDQISTPQEKSTGDVPAQDWTQKQDNGTVTITDAGKEELRKYVTSVDSAVYRFTDTLSSTKIAAALAKLGQHDGTIRATLLDTVRSSTDASQPQQTVTALSDSSAQQFTGHYIVVEDTSNLLAKKLEWGRLTAYVEQPAQHIHFDQKDASGHYRYHIPPQLKGKVRSQYISAMNQIFDIYSKLVTDLTTYIRARSSTPAKERDATWRTATKIQAYKTVQPILPVAARSTVGIYASSQALESLVIHLLSDELSEARTVGKQILDEVRKVTPLLEQSDTAIAYRARKHTELKQLAEKFLPPNHTAETRAVTLEGYAPHNELDSVADMLYEHSDLPLTQLRQEVATWPYQQKVDVLTAYVGKQPSRDLFSERAFEKIRYSFDLLCSYNVFRELQHHRIVDDLGWQALSPRLGYAIPALIEEAGATDLFEQCFDLSLGLYSALQSSGLTLEAQYATLLGHKLRWKVTYTAREAFQWYEQSTRRQVSSEYREFVHEMYAKIAEVHPVLASAMQFTDTDEKPKSNNVPVKQEQPKPEQVDSPKSKE